jgi:hypothetical protein
MDAPLTADVAVALTDLPAFDLPVLDLSAFDLPVFGLPVFDLLGVDGPCDALRAVGRQVCIEFAAAEFAPEADPKAGPAAGAVWPFAAAAVNSPTAMTSEQDTGAELRRVNRNRMDIFPIDVSGAPTAIQAGRPAG